MRNTRVIAMTLWLLICFLGGCATSPQPQPIAYLAIENPNGTIRTADYPPVKMKFPRGGFYVGMYNFRPAPDIGSYLDRTAQEANTNILRNVDMQFVVPFYFDLFLFGYAKGTDSVTSGK